MQGRRFWIVVPSRSFERGKTRLAPLLGADARRDFSRNSFRHVVRAARRVAGAARTVVVSSSGEVLGLARRLGVVALIERKADLNASAHQAATYARQRGALGVVVVHADLPGLRSAELGILARCLAQHAGVVIAPDRERNGTNALGLRSARAFQYRFGPGSFGKHRAEARRRRIRTRIVESPGLARDIDTPEHYRALVGQVYPT